MSDKNKETSSRLRQTAGISRTHGMWEELQEFADHGILDEEKLIDTVDSLERYTVDMPTSTDSALLLLRLRSRMNEAPDGERFAELSPPKHEEEYGGRRMLEELPEVLEEGPARRMVRLMRLVRSQTRMLGWPFWLVSAFLVLLGGWLGFYGNYPADNPLAVVVPALAALSVCAAFRSFGTPMFELEMTMPVTPSQLVYGRLILIIGYDMLIALMATPIAAYGGRAAGVLVAGWLLPLALVSMSALAAVLYVNAFAAAGISMGVWFVYLLMTGYWPGLLPASGEGLSPQQKAVLYVAVVVLSAVLVHLKVVQLNRRQARS